MYFEKVYQEAPDALKLKFLDAIIRHNHKLKEEFVNFAGEKDGITPGLTYDKFAEIIEEFKGTFTALFENVDLENPDWDNYSPPHGGYIEDWEAYQLASEQEFENIFDDFREEAINQVIEQRPEILVAMLIGLYQSCEDADITDDNCSFDDVNEHLLSEHKNTLNSIIEKLRLSALSDHKIAIAFELFFRYCENEYATDTQFASQFEHLLLCLAEKSENQAHLLDILSQPGIEKDMYPELLLFLNKKTGNANEWLKAAQRLYRQNNAVANELLAHYHQTDTTAFLAIARELFETNQYAWAKELQHYLTPDNERELYVKVFWKLTVSNHDVNMYHKIREYLSESDFWELLKEFEWNIVFKVKLLEIEERFDDIREVVDKYKGTSDFAEIIAPIIGKYPDFCFRKIEELTTKTLQNERGRHIYQQIASWLSLAGKIEGFDAESQRLISQTYMHKPNLPALKDEMRKAGLARG